MADLHFDPQYQEQRGFVYIVVGDPPIGFSGYADLEKAAERAYAINGYVLAIPIVANMTQGAWRQNPDRMAFERWREANDDW